MSYGDNNTLMQVEWCTWTLLCTPSNKYQCILLATTHNSIFFNYCLIYYNYTFALVL